MKETIDYNAGLHIQYSMRLPKEIVTNVQKQGFPSRYDELEEVARQAIEFYKSKNDHVKVSEIENFRDFLLDEEEDCIHNS